MIDYTYKDLFMDDSVSKQLIIEYDSTVITNEDLFDQTMTLEESLCSEQELRFGACEASVLKFKVANIVAPMKDKWITVKMILEGHTDEPFIIGRYKVAEDKLTADRMWRDIVAYDAMYDIINADAASMARWYNSVFPDANKQVTMEQFRNSFMFYFDLEQVLPQGGLINDNVVVEKTIEPERISGKDIITAICEINGCFGHIGRDGKFHYIYLPQAIEGLYPANDLYPADDLFPQDPKGANVGSNGSYIDIKWEDFVTESINKIQIRQERNDIGKIYPDTPTSDSDNSYIIQDNFLVYGKSSEELLPIARNILGKITGVTYRPITNSDFKGNPCLEVGDPIRVGTKYELVETYILERTLKGIQALRDSYLANGVKKYTEQVNGVHSSIVQLKSKTNTLTRTIEETRSEIKDMESGLETKILQTAKEIELEAKRAISAEVELAAAIKIAADNITAEVKRATDAEGVLSGKISVNADNITAEVKRATGQEVELAAAIKITEDNIKLKVSKGDVSSEISQESGKITIEANRISIKSDKFTLTEDGKIKAVDGEFSGKITVNSGTIGGFTITNDSIYNNKDSFSSTVNGVFISTSGINIGDNTNHIKVNTGRTPSVEIKIGNSVISNSTVHIQKGNNYPYIDFKDSAVEIYSTAQQYVKIESSGIIIQPTYNTRVKINSSGIVSETGDISIIASSSGTAILGNSSNKIGFFGSSGTTRRSVAAMSATPTVDNLKTKINELITALKNYNLIA